MESEPPGLAAQSLSCLRVVVLALVRSESVTVVVTFLVSLFTWGRPVEEARRYTLKGSGFFQGQRLWYPGTRAAGSFLFILAVLLSLNHLATAVLPGLT
jgi:hypothetical protein